MSDQSVETLRQFRFSSVMEAFFYISIFKTAQSTAPTAPTQHLIGERVIRELTPDASKME